MAERIAAAVFEPVGSGLTSPLPPGDSVAGEQRYADLGCKACHSLDGSALVGPSLLGIGEASKSRVEGYTAEMYLRESIVLPCAHLVEGFTCVMPQDFGERLDAQGLADLLVYLAEQ
jgi:cytochrome c oxidase subunit 2